MNPHPGLLGWGIHFFIQNALDVTCYNCLVNLVLLPGNSANNKEWIEEIQRTIGPLFEHSTIQYYKHWETGASIIDLEEELSVLAKTVESIGEFTVFAKSAGIIVALKGVYDGRLKLAQCVFVGMPVEWSRTNGFDIDVWIKNYSVPTLFIQATSDPACHYEDLQAYIGDMNVENCILSEVGGNNHDYENLLELRAEVEKFLEKGK